MDQLSCVKNFLDRPATVERLCPYGVGFTWSKVEVFNRLLLLLVTPKPINALELMLMLFEPMLVQLVPLDDR